MDRLPWRTHFDLVFSAPVLPVLLITAFVIWAARAFWAKTIVTGLGMLLPGLFVMLVSIVADKGENMRFKFFIEPVMVVFLVSTAACLSGMDRACASRRLCGLPRRFNA